VSDVSLEKARDRANKLTSAARTGRDLIAEEEESVIFVESEADVVGGGVKRLVVG